MGAFTNVGQICDMVEMLCGQGGVNRSKIPRRLLWDILNLKSKEFSRRTGAVDATATITTVANQALYEKPDGMLHIREVHVDNTLAYKITREDVIRLQQLAGTGTTIQGTSVTWHFYEENRGIRGYLGIVDDNGNAPTSDGIEIEVHYSNFPDEITNDNDVIGIPEQYAMELTKGVAAEIMKLNGRMDLLVQSHEVAFERMLRDATFDAVENSQQPLVQFPLDISCE